MKDKTKRLPVADQIRKGLEEAIRHANGEITLKTTTLEMPDRPPEVNAQELTKLRLKNGMSQTVFAQVFNVSTKTVQSWEQGQRKPVAVGLAIDPGVPSKPVRFARARGDVCAEPRITLTPRIRNEGRNTRSVFGSE